MSETGKSDNILDRICIAMPCSMNWEDMQGNDEVRLCGGCDKNVYNVSAMSKKRAEEILSAPTLPCLQLQRREDGTLVTDERSKLVRFFWHNARNAVSTVLAILSIVFPQTAAAADDKVNSVRVKPKRATMTIVGGKPMYTRQATSKKAINSKNVKLAIEEYPSSLDELGISEEDLSMQLNCENAELLSDLNPASVRVVPVSEKSLPKELNYQSWSYFESGRQLHARACFYTLNAQGEEAWTACEKATKLYLQALKERPSTTVDPGFRSFVEQELGKVKALQAKSIRKY